MTKNFKTLLKTTVAATTLMLGAQSWVDATIINSTGADVSGSNIEAAPHQQMFAYGAASADHTGTITLQADERFYCIPFNDGNGDMELTQSGSITLANGAQAYFLSNNATTPKIVVSGALVPNNVTGVVFHLGGAVTLPDLSSFPGVQLNITRSLTLNNAGLGGPVNIAPGATLTRATWTSCGAVSGEGILDGSGGSNLTTGAISDTTVTVSAAANFQSGAISGTASITKGTGTFESGPISGTAAISSTSGDFTAEDISTSGPISNGAGDFLAASISGIGTLANGDGSFTVTNGIADKTITKGAGAFVSRDITGTAAISSTSGDFTAEDISTSGPISNGAGHFTAASINGAGNVTNGAGNFTVTGDVAGSGTVATGAGNVVVNGNVSGSKTIQPGVGNVTVDGSVSGSTTFTLSGMNGSGNTLLVKENFATTNSFTSVPGVGTDGITIIRGNMTLSGATSDLTTAGGMDVYGNLAVNRNTSVASATSLHVGGNATFSGTFGIAGSGVASIDGNATFTGAVAAASGVLSVHGATTLNGALTMGDACGLNLAGALGGSGNLVLSSVTKSVAFGDASTYTGSVALGTGSTTFAKTPKTTFTGHRGNLVLTGGGTVTKITSAGVSAKVTGGTAADTIITEYDLQDATAVEFVPGTGKKMTVTTLTQHAAADENITVGASTGTMIFSNANINVGGAAAHTFSAPTTMKKYTLLAGATPTVTVNENVTIDELDVTNAAVTFVVASGKTLTVKKVTGNSDITVNGAGTMSVKLTTEYTGNLTTGGTAKIKN